MVGELFPNGTFLKHVRYSVHYFHKAGAFGIDEAIVKYLKEKGCKKIVIKEEEADERWETPFEVFWEKSWVHKFPNFQPQRFLAKERWDIFDAFGLPFQMRNVDKIFLPSKKQVKELSDTFTASLFN